MLLAVALAAIIPRTAASRADCFKIRGEYEVYTVAEVITEVEPWVGAGAPRAVEKGSALGLLGGAFELESDTDPATWSPECRIAMLGVTLSTAILTAARVLWVDTWKVFFGLPWEDMLRTDWPIFDLVAAWARSEPQVSNKPTLAFWRTCHEEAAAFWHSSDVLAAGLMLEAALPMPTLRARAAEIATAALLGQLDLATYGGDRICTSLPWALLMLVFTLAQSDALATPGYALRYTQALAQRYYDDVDNFIDDLTAAPWPVLPLLARVAAMERARKPRLDTIAIPSMPGESAAARRASAVPPAFTQLGGHAARELASALEVAHKFLAALGLQYIAIAGTLLGAVRHLGRIPWDDDIDLCIDATQELKLQSLVLAEGGHRLGVGEIKGVGWRARRALHYLMGEGYVLKISAARALVYRISRAGSAEDDDPSVDIWLCWGLVDPDAEEVTLMSREHGPRVPRAAVAPFRKLPFGELAVWAPRDPGEVTRLYVLQSDWSGDFMNTCRGRKLHGAVASEYTDEVPCAALAEFAALAGPWEPLGPGADRDEVQGALEHIFRLRLPGLGPLDPAALTIHAATMGPAMPPRVRVSCSVAAADGHERHCEALLWRGGGAKDLLAPGASPDGGPVLRSLVCGEYVWEDWWT